MSLFELEHVCFPWQTFPYLFKIVFPVSCFFCVLCLFFHPAQVAVVLFCLGVSQRTKFGFAFFIKLRNTVIQAGVKRFQTKDRLKSEQSYISLKPFLSIALPLIHWTSFSQESRNLSLNIKKPGNKSSTAPM